LQQRAVDAVLRLLQARDLQFSHNHDRDRDRERVQNSAPTAAAAVADLRGTGTGSAGGGGGAAAIAALPADRERMQQKACVTLAERVRTAATPAAFAAAWMELQQYHRRQHERQLQLVDLFTDIGLISRSTVTASRAVAATSTTAAAASSTACASVTLSLLGGFDTRDVRSVLDRWAIPSELRESLLSSLRRILLPAWARVHSTSAALRLWRA